jgi:hypothetical protein
MAKSTNIALISVAVAALACNLAAPTSEPTASETPAPAELPTSTPPPPATEPPQSDRRCGDGICDGPENAANCPADCGEGLPVPDRRDGYDAYRLTNPTSGVELFVAVVRPDNWDGTPMPTLIIIPGGIDHSAAITERPLGRAANEAGFVAVAFDPDGRGNSGGTEDYNGFVHQDGLAAVVEFAASLPEVDPDRMGMASLSYGITMAAGTLARYPELPIRFLVDWEGPADRTDTGGCGGDDIGKLNQDAACDDEEYWAGHEALTFMPRVRVPYQRVQSEVDHVQPDVRHAVRMVNAAVDGASPWVRLNDLPPNQLYDEENPPRMLPEAVSDRAQALVLEYAQELLAQTAGAAQTGVTPVYVTAGTRC